MSSGFVSSNALDEERQKRQEEWEKVRKPEDPQTAPEPEVCNKTLFEQLKDNRDAKQAEIEESKKFKNMIRGIDEDESDFLSQVDEMKAQTHIQNKQEEEQVLKEMASKRVITVEAPTLNKVAPVLNPTTKPVSAQANILSAAIKRKATNDKKDSDSEPKIARKDSQVKEAVAASAVIGHIAGLVHYEASSDSESNSSDSDAEIIPSLQTSRPEKKRNGNC